MQQSLIHFLKKYKFEHGKPFVVGVSGGADSMVLWHLLHQLKPVLKLNYEIIHFNFHLRGDESNRDEAHVRNMADFFKDKLTVVDSPLKKGSSVQERAREVRLAYFSKKFSQQKDGAVFLAHHQDDQLETYTIRQQRGAGERGLACMWPVTFYNHFSIYRPLLNFSRKKIRTYGSAHHVLFVEDSSNATAAYLRNRVRHQVVGSMSSIEKKKILHAIKTAQKNEQTIRKKTDQFLKNKNIISKINFFRQNQAVRFSIIRRLIANMNEKRELSQKNYLQIEKVLKASRSVAMPFGSLLLLSEGKTFYFVTQKSFCKKGPEPAVLPGLGCYENIELFEKKVVRLSPHSLYLDAQKVSFPLILKPWQPGERFIPYGRRNPQKIKDYLAKKGFSAFQKQKVLALYGADSKLLALVGVEIDARYALPKLPGKALIVKKNECSPRQRGN
ncbi:tRNA lysidine(34) synthetase TilS [bacterium]|nr:tRNA lysidine(34) synthetase TilS [bacterium]